MNRRILELLQLLLIVFVVVLLNLVSNRAFFRIDITEEKMYSLSEVSTDVVQTLAEPLTVRAFFTEDLPAPYNNVEQQLRDLFEEYAVENRRFFSYTFHTIGSDENTSEARRAEFEDLAYTHRVFPIQIQVVEQDEVKAKRAYMGVSFAHGDAIETIQAITGTERIEYQITQAIRALNDRISSLVNIEEDIYTMLFLSSSFFRFSADLEAIPETTEVSIKELNRRSNERIRYAYLDPDTQPEAYQWIDAYRVTPLSATSDESGETRTLYASVIVTYADRAYRLDLLQPGYEGFEIVTSEAIENFIDDSISSLVGFSKEIGYLVDYDTPPYRGKSGTVQKPEVEVDLSSFYPLLTSTYSLKAVFLERGEKIPEELNTLIVVAPRERLSDYALLQIDQFLMKGNSVLLFLDAYDIELPMVGGQLIPGDVPFYTLRETGIEELIAHYGVAMKPSYVLDENCFVQRQQAVDGSIEEAPLYFAPRIEERNVNRDLAFMTGVSDLIMLSVSPLEYDPTRQDGVTAHVLFTSSEKSWEHIDDPNFYSPVYAEPSGRYVKEKIALAYLLEGSFESYFADRPLPSREDARAQRDTEAEGSEAEDPEGGISFDDVTAADDFVARGTDGKLFVIGSSAILGDNLLDPDGMSPNSLFLLNLLDRVNDNEETAELRGKGRRLRPLERDTSGGRFFAKMFNVAGLPIIVAIAGGIAWLVWFARRRRVQRAFSTGSSKENW